MGRRRATEGENGAAVAAKPVESKADRFVRLANKRVPKALKSIRAVQKLASKVSYESTPEQVNAILNTLAKAYNQMKNAFEGIKEEDAGFQL